MWRSILRLVKRQIIRMHKRRGVVFISDTTLRDGEQMPGVRLNPDQKVAIAKALAAAGIHSIDAGFPAAAPEEIAAIQRIVREAPGPVLTAHCRTLKGDIDKAAEALEGCRLTKKGVQLFIGISPLHRERKHGKTKAEIIQMATDAIQYAKQHFEIISFGPEDASRTEPEYLCQVYKEAIAAGATSVGFADTVGILTPEKTATYLKTVHDKVPNIGDALVGVHFHNDLGLGTANALAAVSAGANIVQGTINGIGERAGNTALEEVVTALHLHQDQYKVTCHFDPKQIAQLSRLVAELTRVKPAPNKAVVGDFVFSTEAGVHQDGLLKDPATYVPYMPEVVGADPIQLILGKHSGKSAVKHVYHERGLDLSDAEVQEVLKHLKEGTELPLHRSDADFQHLLYEVFGDSPKRPPETPRKVA